VKKFIALLTLMFSLQAQAALLTVKLDRDQFTAGDEVIADIWISDLTTPLAGFDLSLWFDDSLFSFNQLVFGNKLSIKEVSIQDQSVVGNVLNFSETSFDFYYDLAEQQGSAFVLARITFDAIKGGMFDLKLDHVLLVDADGFEFDANLIKVVDAQGNVVPAPATALLLLPALLFLGRRRQLAAR